MKSLSIKIEVKETQRCILFRGRLRRSKLNVLYWAQIDTRQFNLIHFTSPWLQIDYIGDALRATKQLQISRAKSKICENSKPLPLEPIKRVFSAPPGQHPTPQSYTYKHLLNEIWFENYSNFHRLTHNKTILRKTSTYLIFFFVVGVVVF